MKLLIMPNVTRPEAIACGHELGKFFLSQGCEVFFCETLRSEMPLNEVCFLPRLQALHECDLVVSVGGDGTLIRAAKQAVTLQKPVFGVNRGRLGFLTSCEAEDTEKLSALVNGHFHIEKRMMLTLSLPSSTGKRETYDALNDIVISHGSVSQLVDLHLECNHTPVGNYYADGMIFATPTGSTAYNLSAGGPVTDPTIESILMTPICPHSLSARAILFSPTATLAAKRIDQNRSQNVYVTIDGQTSLRLEREETLLVTKSEKYAQMVVLNGQTFYQNLNEKFRIKG